MNEMEESPPGQATSEAGTEGVTASYVISNCGRKKNCGRPGVDGGIGQEEE